VHAAAEVTKREDKKAKKRKRYGKAVATTAGGDRKASLSIHFLNHSAKHDKQQQNAKEEERTNHNTSRTRRKSQNGSQDISQKTLKKYGKAVATTAGETERPPFPFVF